MTWLRNVFSFVYDILLGCRHASLTRPFTIKAQTYKVCLECGKQIQYSLDTMRPLTGRELRQLKAAHARELITVLPVCPAGHPGMAAQAQNSNAAA